MTQLPQSIDGRYGAVVELDTASDTVDAAAENHDAVILKIYVMLCTVVGEVEVIGNRRKLSCNSVNLVDHWCYSCFDSHSSDSKLCGFPEFRNLRICEPELLRAAEQR